MNLDRDQGGSVVDSIWPPDLTITVPKVHAENDLAITLRELRDPSKTREVLTALYANQYGQPLGRREARSLTVAIGNAPFCFSGSTERAHEDGSVLAVMQLSKGDLLDLKDMGKVYRDVLVAATNPLRETLEYHGLVGYPRFGSIL